MSHIVHLGDCLEGLRTLEDKSVDSTIGDPPYSEHVDRGQAVSGRRSGQAVIRKEQIGVGFLTDERIHELCFQVVRVTKRWINLFCAWEQISQYKREIEAAGGRYIRACAWEKPDSTPQLTGDRPATWGECFVVAYANPAGAMTWNGGGKRGLYRTGVCRGAERGRNDEGETLHPTQKPLRLMRDLVSDFSEPGDLVLDPYTGSGTTGVACKQLGRDFIGWELSKDWYELACRRIAGEAAFVHPQQIEMFGGAA